MKQECKTTHVQKHGHNVCVIFYLISVHWCVQFYFCRLFIKLSMLLYDKQHVSSNLCFIASNENIELPLTNSKIKFMQKEK